MRIHEIAAAAVFTLPGVVASTNNPNSHPPRPTAPAPRAVDSTELVPGIARDRMIAPASLIAALAAVHRRIPSFSRQTKLACSARHYQFPQLTPFGRLCKLNG